MALRKIHFQLCLVILTNIAFIITRVHISLVPASTASGLAKFIRSQLAPLLLSSVLLRRESKSKASITSVLSSAAKSSDSYSNKVSNKNGEILNILYRQEKTYIGSLKITEWCWVRFNLIDRRRSSRHSCRHLTLPAS